MDLLSIEEILYHFWVVYYFGKFCGRLISRELIILGDGVGDRGWLTVPARMQIISRRCDGRELLIQAVCFALDEVACHIIDGYLW
mmetsp:Transcript_18003/g.38876  ORF Transcript_18003/g.38876 Transcript_18003/m.38876 type:complete len:85 (-) Transcript_18003:180-434(-)